MNIALEKTDEYVNGQKRRTYGDAFVRGNNGEPKTKQPPTPSSYLRERNLLTFSSHVHLRGCIGHFYAQTASK